jgi:hypothetical protein
MTAIPTDSDILPNIPDAESVRRRLAVVLTEADLLRAQLRVSTRLERERERLRQQAVTASKEGRRDE